MTRCQICQHPIWEGRWPEVKDKSMKKFICYYCFTHLKSTGYKPKRAKVSHLMLCDSCGELSDKAEKTDSGWVCEDCSEAAF